MALLAGMNQGICAALISFNTVYAILVSYFFFKETVTKVKLGAIILMVTSVFMVGMFQKQQPSQNQVTESNLASYQLLTVVSGMICSLAYGSVMLSGKFIMKKCEDAFSIGFCFLFVCGCYGLISFIIEVIRDY